MEESAQAAQPPVPSDVEQLKNQLHDLEGRLIEQDHRFFHVIWTAFQRGRRGSTDPHRNAARKALLWCWLRPGPIAATGGLVGLVTLFFIYRQTEAMLAQNELQATSDYETRKATLLAIIYDPERKSEPRPSFLEIFFNEPKKPDPEPDQPDLAKEPRVSHRARREAAQSYAMLQIRRNQPVDLSEASIHGFTLYHGDLHNSDFSYAYLYFAHLIEANLSFANLGFANLTNAQLCKALLFGANLRRAKLSGAHLQGADLQRAALHNADLRFAHLTGALCAGANFEDADLRAADMRSVSLPDAKLTGALWDKYTKWPDGFDPNDLRHRLIKR